MNNIPASVRQYVDGINKRYKQEEMDKYEREAVDKLIADLEKAKEALRFYANKNFYTDNVSITNIDGSDELPITYVIMMDEGEIARNTLKEI